MEKKYFDNEILDRLCEAAILANKLDVQIYVDATGFTIRRGNNREIRISFLEFSEAKINVLLPWIEECSNYSSGRHK